MSTFLHDRRERLALWIAPWVAPRKSKETRELTKKARESMRRRIEMERSTAAEARAEYEYQLNRAHERRRDFDRWPANNGC